MSKQKTVSVEYPVLKDILGNEVYPGDVLLEYGCGGTSFDGQQKYAIKLWEMIYPFDGHGFNYNIDGSKYKFAWCSVKQSIKVDFDQFAPVFKYSFYHGMSKLYTTIERGTLKELIDNSDWKNDIVKPSDVELFKKKKNLTLESIDDIKKNMDLLTGPGATPRVAVDKILDIAGASHAPVINGEIGFAAIQDSISYSEILDKIKNS